MSVVYSEYKTRNTVNQIKMAVKTSFKAQLTNLVYNAKYGKPASRPKPYLKQETQNRKI